MANIYIIFQTNLRSFTVAQNIALGNPLFGTVKLTKNANYKYKYKYSGNDFGFDAHEYFLSPGDKRFGKNVITFDADMILSVLIDHKKKDFLILSKGSTDSLT